MGRRNSWFKLVSKTAGLMAESGLFEPRPDPRAGRKAQPSLFDIRQTPVRPELRYPRGYTPQRMREIRDTTKDLIDIPGARLNSQQFGTYGGMAQSVDHPFYHPHGERLIQEAIARSTIPVHHLEGLRGGIQLMPERKVGQAGMGGTLGLYTVSSRKIRLLPVPAATPKRGPHAGQRMIEPMGRAVPMREQMWGYGKGKTKISEMVPKSSPRQLQQAEATLIHEIGHHVSKGVPGGEEEARADRYMMAHWRPLPRNVRKHQDIDIGRSTYLGRLGPGGRYSEETLRQAGVPDMPPPRRRRKS